jgi:hypothetical protein
VIEKSVKVNLLDKKLTETAIKVEYRLSYFTFDVLYHLSLLFVNLFWKYYQEDLNLNLIDANIKIYFEYLLQRSIFR